ncbi:MAG: metallophosphoesterase [Thermaerobacter sp.]|nr:metallophosphoesterase [Thermaerobacter sp.]
MWGWLGPIAALGAAYAVAVEPRWLRPVTYDVRLSRLSTAFDGLTILHLSDLHGRVEVFLSPIFQKWSAACDIIVVTGDLYSAVLPRQRMAARLDALTARDGVYYVSGNHDYRRGRLDVAPWVPGQRLLDNRAAHLKRGGAGLWLAGLPDLVKGEPRWSDLRRMWADSRDPVVLLSHRPDAALLAGNEVGLVLSGHTHGGQVAIPGFGAVFRHNRLPGRYVGGMLAGTPHVITSRGLGTSELPVRFAARPEIVRVRLWANQNTPREEQAT